ncbi:glutamine--fructose-6-phosphate transaminase (isomerizing) [Conexibacter sp. S30A1]|uniref:glutamine--fructose-6-phosphate transaminase (isomerizing) n=1 Tax=Conexibacter sp. S30A1 TaxID=2937800 RepID=UPI00200CAF51|nr:glutamine--fructose-6-phosphate transaminase (isomerizing) [Conexibacter sp. S30A1]
MCGIVGYVGRQDAVPVLLEGLARLEYRGYDSAGIAVVRNGTLRVHKRAGKVRDLAASMPKRLSGQVGIAHTRWATHGQPSDANAHPHVDMANRIAVVHNGMIEDSALLRERLRAEGVQFSSETDTELLAHLIAREDADDLEEAVRRALRRVHGAYGIAVLDATAPDRIVLARNGSPVLIGIGDHQMLCASDMAALVRHAQQVVHLEDGELATVTAESFSTATLDARPTVKTATTLESAASDYERGGFEHFMLKEISEQPQAIDATLRGRLDARLATARLGGLNLTARELRAFRRVHVIACGSALYAGMVGAGMLESLARIPAAAESAAEFRYRNAVIEPETLYVAVSQSGETADTLAAVEEIARKGGRVLGVVNVPGSSIARAVDGGIYLHAGPELSVASTKAFTSMTVAFALLALHLGRLRDLGPADGQRLLSALAKLPDKAAEALAAHDELKQLAAWIASAQSSFFIGRVRGYPVALEGAQKLKEVSYVHAEAYPAAELKHGPLALISPELPTVAIVPDDELLEKNLASLEQIHSRGGEVLAVAHRQLGTLADRLILVPKSEPELDPILLGLPLQLLAYYAAAALGRDIDQPRNLAKSVTVE